MNACAQIKQPSHKWDSDETDLFCEILADPVNNFMENLKSEREVLESIQQWIIWFHYCRI